MARIAAKFVFQQTARAICAEVENVNDEPVKVAAAAFANVRRKLPVLKKRMPIVRVPRSAAPITTTSTQNRYWNALIPCCPLYRFIQPTRANNTLSGTSASCCRRDCKSIWHETIADFKAPYAPAQGVQTQPDVIPSVSASTVKGIRLVRATTFAGFPHDKVSGE
jgi:hypothetical protein